MTPLVTLRADLLAIVRAALGAADAGILVERALTGDVRPNARPEGRAYTCIAVGKASAPMAKAASHVLGDRLRTGLIISPAAESVAQPFEHIAGGHPIPTEGSEQAGRGALRLAREAASAGDDVLVLISGGASALMAVPADGVTLDDKRKTTDRLLRSGADIHALNTVRKHLSAIKGGQLAAAAAPARCIAFAVSDVVGDDPSVIGSGPAVADPSTFADALTIIDRFGGRAAFPPAIVSALTDGAAGTRSETPKPGDPRLSLAETTVIGGRHNAMQGAAKEASARGYSTAILDTPVVGDAREAARTYIDDLPAHVAALKRPACVISSGETTVRVTGSGRGGRNQEFALAAAEGLATFPAAVLGSAGTDGVDGPTDAAGAVADNTTVERARREQLPIAGHLNDNNSYAFFDRLGDLIRTGPTGTNVGDLQVFLLA